VTTHSTTHATFTLERVLQAPPGRVFAAFAESELKNQWFIGPPSWEKTDHTLDFRVGGREFHRVGPPGGELHTFDAHYEDIVPDERIVFAYQMLQGDRRISVSLTTVELSPDGPGTRLVFTEQAVFLDGHDDAGRREEGTNILLDQLTACVGNAADR
jgi:uncharacterized protein YndB with AHSA1/START domain